MVGNLSAYREFLNVQDVVRAYCLLMKKGKSKQVYNIGCAKPITIKKLLSHIIKISRKNIVIKVDPANLSTVDIKNNSLDPSRLNVLDGNRNFL